MDDKLELSAAQVIERAVKAERELAVTIPAAGRFDDVRMAITRNAMGQIEIKSLKPVLEEFAKAPARNIGQADVYTLASFIELVNRNKTATSVIFAETDNSDPSFTAVLDYLLADKPSFGDHRVHYAFPTTPEWRTWFGGDQSGMDQRGFAAFIEDNIADIVAATPEERDYYERLFHTKFGDPSDLMGISRNFAVTAEVNVKEMRINATGEAIMSFEENHGDVTAPGLFVLSLPFFKGAEKVRLIARLRYRLSNGRVTWHYHLYRWDVVMRDYVLGDLKKAQEETGLPVFEGTDEAVSRDNRAGSNR